MDDLDATWSHGSQNAIGTSMARMTSATVAIPPAISSKPAATRMARRGTEPPDRNSARSCTHAPPTHASAPAVNARPTSDGGSPRWVDLSRYATEEPLIVP